MKRKEYDIKLSMDDLQNDNRSEKLTGFASVYTQATSVFFFFILVYSYLQRKFCIDGIVALIVETFVSTFLFTMIIRVIGFYSKKRWITKNKRIWIKGCWLHVHEKNDGHIRVGYAVFSQSYDSIDVAAKNFELTDILNQKLVTNWHYYSAQIENYSELRGFYYSHKDPDDTTISNTGIHLLSIDSSNEYPLQMSGSFSDTHLLENSVFNTDSFATMSANSISTVLKKAVEDNRQHFGHLSFFRMSKDQMVKLFPNGVFSPEKFEQMLCSDDEAGAYFSYVKQLRSKIQE